MRYLEEYETTLPFQPSPASLPYITEYEWHQEDNSVQIYL